MRKKSVSTRLSNLRKMGQKRRREIAYMIMSISILVIGVPFALHQLTVWNEKVTYNYDTEPMLKTDYWNMTNVNGFGESGKVVLFEYKPLGNAEVSVQDSNVVWGEDVNVSMNSLVISSEVTGSPGESDYSEIFLVLDLHIADLMEYDRMLVRVNTPTKAEAKIQYCLDYEDVHEGTSFSTSDFRTLAVKWDGTTGNRTHWWNFSTLDLMVDRVEYENRWHDGDDNPMIMVNVRTPAGSMFETGDIIQWDVDLVLNTIPQIKEKTALEYGALIIGLILIGIAWVSTPWWNPSDPNNPGWFDRLLSAVFFRIGNFMKSNREAKKRRKR